MAKINKIEYDYNNNFMLFSFICRNYHTRPVMWTKSYATLIVAAIINWISVKVHADELSRWCLDNQEICSNLIQNLRGMLFLFYTYVEASTASVAE